MRIRIDHNGDWSTIYTDGDPSRTVTAARYIAEAYLDEPLFCIRGRDKLAIPTAKFYLSLLHAQPDIVGPVEEHINTDIAVFAHWQNRYPGLLKYPDRKVI